MEQIPVLLSLAVSVPPFSWTTWSGDGTLRAGLLLLVGGYLLGIGPLRERFRLGPPVSRGRIALYMSGVLLLFLALEGPLHELSDTYLFSAHMVQHMVVTLFAPPLLLLGTPGWLLRPIVLHRYVRPVFRALVHPLPAGILFNVVFTFYHWPAYYNPVSEDHNLHVASHIVFIALAVITWWPLLSPMAELPPLPYPLRMVYTFGQTLSGFLVGSFVTNAKTVLYPFYEQAPRVWGISPLDDQQFGGLIMWVAGGFYYLLIFSAFFFTWAYKEGIAGEVVEVPRRTGGVQLPLPHEALRHPAREAQVSSPVPLGARHVAPAPDKMRMN